MAPEKIHEILGWNIKQNCSWMAEVSWKKKTSNVETYTGTEIVGIFQNGSVKFLNSIHTRE